MLEKLPDAVGHALHHVRAGLDQIAFNLVALRTGMAALQLSSLAFADHAPIPALYTADGEGISPPLQWTGVPAGAASLLLIVEDADAPAPHPLVHAIVFDLPAQDGSLTDNAMADPALKTGRNSYLQTGWLPPDPPPGHGVHRYVFELFALAAGPAFSATPGRDEVIQALHERAMASGLLTGTYERPDGSIKLGVKLAEPALKQLAT